MNQATFDRVAAELMAEAAAIQTSKRPGYTLGNEDVLKNFKAAAERAGVTPEQAWTVYFLKHIDAITSVMTRPDLPVSEAPLGRFSDAVNYLQLGYALFVERDEATTKSRLTPSCLPAALACAGSSLLTRERMCCADPVPDLGTHEPDMGTFGG